ncbi:MAG: hypothetical protein ACE5D7_09380 [Fidelibacterota bacterium]
MKRNRDRSEIYILSLDTFMLLAVLGITLGILFLVVNPLLNPGVVLPVAAISDRTVEEYNTLFAQYEFVEIDTSISLDLAFFNEHKKGNKLRVINKLTSKYENELYFLRAGEDDISQITVITRRNDSFIRFQFMGISWNFSAIPSLNKEAFKKEAQNWEELLTIFREKNEE